MIVAKKKLLLIFFWFVSVITVSWFLFFFQYFYSIQKKIEIEQKKSIVLIRQINKNKRIHKFLFFVATLNDKWQFSDWRLKAVRNKKKKLQMNCSKMIVIF